MKKIIAGFALLLLAPALAFAVTQNVTYTAVQGDTLSSVASKFNLTVSQLVALNPQLPIPKGTVLVVGTQTVTPPPVVPPTTGEIVIKNAYTTAYGWPDNTPAGNNTTIMGVSGHDTGTGTFADPITMATGYSLATGKEVDDYTAGTKFYDPNLRKYFVIGDTCGDGNSPQTEACHKSEISGTIQLDMWVGGQGANKNSVLSCEDAVTRVGTLIENPASNYAVVLGSVFNGTCSTQFGDTLVTQ